MYILRNALQQLRPTFYALWDALKAKIPRGSGDEEGQGREHTTITDFISHGGPGAGTSASAGVAPVRENGMASTFEFSESGDLHSCHGKPRQMISEWQAGWNVTNAIQGMFVVALPYAVLHGGYWAIIAMIGVAYICCYTGRILVDCLYEKDVDGALVRVRDSYVAIADVCFGPGIGGRIVNCAQLVELSMTCILYVVVCGDLLRGVFPDGPIVTRSWMLICGVILLPTAFLRNLHNVSTLSFWCTVAHLIINVAILSYCIFNIQNWAWSKVQMTLDIATFPISLGIIVFSYTSQIFLPSLEGNMRDPGMFWPMLKWSHIAAAVFKALFGYLGFLTWGDATQEVITNNLDNLPTFKEFINFVLVLKALLSYPLPYFAAVELIQDALFRGPPETPFDPVFNADGKIRIRGMVLRVGLVIFTVAVAAIIPHFALLMGFIGSITGTMLSFIWPCYFHLKLKGHEIDRFTRYYDCFVIFLGFLFGSVGIISSGLALEEAFEIGLIN